jgi:oxalate decarboxylase/phosphoglucose isomerase-like protein (cupin superfamily)
VVHEIRNTGNDPLRTLNVYVPPAYTEDGKERPAGKVMTGRTLPRRETDSVN